MDLVDRPNLPVCSPVIAKPGDGVALEVRLGTCILLPGVVCVQIVLGGNGMEQVAGKLIDLYRPRL